MNIAYLVPSRGRPHNAARLAREWRATAAPETHLIFLVDEDDPELPGYEVELDEYGDEQICYITDERRRVGPSLNHWAPKFAASYDAIGFMGDDHLPHGRGWDITLATFVTHPLAVVYGDDLLQRQNLPTAVLLNSFIIKTLGYMVPPGLIHLYLDNFWRDLGQKLGTLRYVPEVIIEHIHPVAGKVDWDDRYREVNSGVMYADDAATYAAYQSSNSFAYDVERLREACDS